MISKLLIEFSQILNCLLQNFIHLDPLPCGLGYARRRVVETALLRWTMEHDVIRDAFSGFKFKRHRVLWLNRLVTAVALYGCGAFRHFSASSNRTHATVIFDFNLVA